MSIINGVWEGSSLSLCLSQLYLLYFMCVPLGSVGVANIFGVRQPASHGYIDLLKIGMVDFLARLFYRRPSVNWCPDSTPKYLLPSPCLMPLSGVSYSSIYPSSQCIHLLFIPLCALYLSFSCPCTVHPVYVSW